MCCVLLRGVASFGGYKLLIFSMLHLLQMLQGFLPEILGGEKFWAKKNRPDGAAIFKLKRKLAKFQILF